jgi:CRP-like cAMP-binding protein
VAAENHLIELLPRADRKRLLALCEPVDLTLSDILNDAGAPTDHVYFPIASFVSLVAAVDDSPGLEVGMIGREGMLGVEAVLGMRNAPFRALVQGAGSARRITARAFRSELAASAGLRTCLDRYVFVLMLQLASSAACLRFHLVGPRLARWLLMSQDRAHSSQFRVTHEFLAYMLGVRRVGVTVSAGELQRQGLIEYHRGALTVLDRKGLEAAACSCYSTDSRIYREHLC